MKKSGFLPLPLEGVHILKCGKALHSPAAGQFTPFPVAGRQAPIVSFPGVPKRSVL
jgi:hypothetical protein